MKIRYTVVLSMIAGAALGGAAIQGLHAQAKPKAYTVSELETLDPAAQAAFTQLAHLAGTASEEALYLSSATRISLQGLLLAGIGSARSASSST